MIGRPAPTEYAPLYAGYVSDVPEDDIVRVLQTQPLELRSHAASVPTERECFRYGAGKWSVRELFGHLGDAERVFGYRAFCISRGETASLPGFDEKQYIARAAYDNVPLADLVEQLIAVRETNLMCLRRLEESTWTAQGLANGTPVTVRALAFIMAGHVRHHLRILTTRYGLSAVAAPVSTPSVGRGAPADV